MKKILVALTLGALIMGRTALATETTVRLRLDANQLTCSKGQLVMPIPSAELGTKHPHYLATASFASQWQCYEFIVDTIRLIGNESDVLVHIELIDTERTRKEEFEYNCRWHGGGLAGPREHCSRGVRDVKYYEEKEKISYSLNGARFSNEVVNSRKLSTPRAPAR